MNGLDWIHDELCNQKVDLWSMGCVFYTMLNGYTPFNVDLSTGDGYEDVANCNFIPFA